MLPKVLNNFLFGNLMSRTMLFVLVPLIIASYFGILGVAALLPPESYDWRYNSISQLLYARDNPEFHHIASICVAGFGVLMIPCWPRGVLLSCALAKPDRIRSRISQPRIIPLSSYEFSRYLRRRGTEEYAKPHWPTSVEPGA